QLLLQFVEHAQEPVAQRLPAAFLRKDLVRQAALLRAGRHGFDELAGRLHAVSGPPELATEMRRGRLARVFRAVADEDGVGATDQGEKRIDLLLFHGRPGRGRERTREEEPGAPEANAATCACLHDAGLSSTVPRSRTRARRAASAGPGRPRSRT